MKLSQWAKQQGIGYQAAWNQYKKGKIKGAYQLETGTIIVPNDINLSIKQKVVVYARVSSSENKSNLDSQATRLVSYCNARGWSVDRVVKEIGSGLNDKRKKLHGILVDKSVTKIVVEHKDRLAIFGLHYLSALLALDSREIIIVNSVHNDEEDIMQDFISIITSFTARLYGNRRSKRKTEKIIAELNK